MDEGTCLSKVLVPVHVTEYSNLFVLVLLLTQCDFFLSCEVLLLTWSGAKFKHLIETGAIQIDIASEGNTTEQSGCFLSACLLLVFVHHQIMLQTVVKVPMNVQIVIAVVCWTNFPLFLKRFFLKFSFNEIIFYGPTFSL